MTFRYAGWTANNVPAVFLVITGFAYTYLVFGIDVTLEQLSHYLVGSMAALLLWVACLFAYGVWRAPGKLREGDAVSQIQDKLEDSAWQELRSALRLALAASDLCISSAVFFGSAAGGYTMRDVDLIVIHDCVDLNTLQQTVSKAREIGSYIEQLFGYPVHFQWFGQSEREAIRRFVQLCSATEPILGEDLWAAILGQATSASS